MAIAEKVLLFYSAYSFSPPYNEAKRPPATGRDRSCPSRLQTPCTYHLTTVAIADKILLFHSAYFFSPPYNEAKRAPATARDRSWPHRPQKPCFCHLTTVAIADSSSFFILPIPFLRPTKLKRLQPPAGTDPGHVDFNNLALTT